MEREKNRYEPTTGPARRDHRIRRIVSASLGRVVGSLRRCGPLTVLLAAVAASCAAESDAPLDGPDVDASRANEDVDSTARENYPEAITVSPAFKPIQAVQLPGVGVLNAPIVNAATGDVTFILDIEGTYDADALQDQVEELQGRNPRLSDTFKEIVEDHSLNVPEGDTYRWEDFDGTLTATASGVALTIPGSEVQATASWWQSIVATAAGAISGLVVRALCIGIVPEAVVVCAAIGGFTMGFVRGVLLQWFDGTLRDGKAWAGTLVSAIVAAVGAGAWESGINRWSAETLPGILQSIANGVKRWATTLKGWLGGVADGLVQAANTLWDFARYIPEAVRDLTRSNFNYELARRWAPIHFQDTDVTGVHSHDGRADYITRVDFDGDWVGRNNWENMVNAPLKAYVYYSVVETPTNWFIIYMFFHPRDWTDSPFETEHENDAEGVLLTVERDGSAFGVLRAAVTVFHSDFYSFTPTTTDPDQWSGGLEDIDGVLFTASSPHDGYEHPVTAQQAKGHGLKAWGPNFGINGDGVIYYPGDVAEEPENADDRDVQYKLIDIFDPGIGLWARRNQSELFVTPTRFAGGDEWDGDDSCGAYAWECNTDAANPPWGWDDGDDLPGIGEIATDPVKLVREYFSFPGTIALDYYYNPYQGILDHDTVPPIEMIDDGGDRPAVPGNHSECRPDGLVPGSDSSPLYCLVYQGDGREWLGAGRSRRIVAYFNGARSGGNGPRYLVKDIPWSSVTHINYAFAHVNGNRISVGADDASNPAIGMAWPGVAGAEMDTSLPYRGHFNLLKQYKARHPRVKTLISVGGWADSGGFYAMVANSDGAINQSGITTFAESVVDFLRTYSFDGVDIDFEYPSILADAGNPDDWGTADPRRAILPDAYAKLMEVLRDHLDRAGNSDGRYYLLTSASSASGYTVRGMANQKALRYQDFTNMMTYDLHGSWNEVVGPNAPLYDDGSDPELVDLYTTPEYQSIGYFNTDWAFHYMRGAMQAGRINIGIPYYTRGWRNVTGGENGLWGSASGTDCPAGTGINRPCGDGAVGIDNIWHDVGPYGEIASGINPMWHAKNLEHNILPFYAAEVGLNPDSDPADQLTGMYQRYWDDTTHSSWLWNTEKRVFLSTTDTQGIDAIADYVKAHGAGGVMMWELSGDYDCPAEVTAANPCIMGNTLTKRLRTQLADAGEYGTSRNTGSSRTMPSAAIDVKVDFVDFPEDPMSLWPLTPVVRITNETGVTIGGDKDTRLSFDLPTSTSSLIKDAYWQTGEQGGKWSVAPGHTGSNAESGLSGTFHRVSTHLDYCQIIPPGRSLDIPIIYFLPVTGPVNTVLRTAGSDYALASEHNRGSSAGSVGAGGCSAVEWDDSKIYNPQTQPIEETTVRYQGQIWTAKWWTQNNIPGTGSDSDHEPWRLIGPAE